MAKIIDNILGRAIVVRGDDIDTDRIIPARFLKELTFANLGGEVFADERKAAIAKGVLHPFDEPKYIGASILIVNSNFGCGSSREHAAQALLRWGINAIVGISFSEIFFGNCLSIGVPCVKCDTDTIAKLQDLVEQEPTLSINVSVVNKMLIVKHESFAINIPEATRLQFIDGSWDVVGTLLEARNEIMDLSTKIPYLNF
jgi:3-isopropylmalate/(R)-2-methylmalate dehydratase small subunit